MIVDVNNKPTKFIFETSTIADGNMGFNFGDSSEVSINRENFLKRLGLKYNNCIVMQSKHLDVVQTVNQAEKAGPTNINESLEADALITQAKNTPLLLTTADCLPVVFMDAVTETIALVHVSRHTLILDLVEKTLAELTNKLSVTPTNLIVNIGPHIRKNSYKFSTPLDETHPTLIPYTEEVNDFAYIDLTRCCLDRLSKAGISKERVSVSEVDTVASDEHFSHYRSVNKKAPTGRMATIVTMTKD